MATLALERAILALEPTAVEFIRVITAIVIVVTPPLAWYAFAVGTLELRLRTLAVQSFAQVFRLVRVVTTVVLEVTQPPLRYAPVVLALIVRGCLALRTVLRQLIRTVAAIILTVAEQPFWYAAVIGLSRTPLPSSRAVPLSTHVGRFIRVIATIVVEITNPQLRYTPTILTREF